MGGDQNHTVRAPPRYGPHDVVGLPVRRHGGPGLELHRDRAHVARLHPALVRAASGLHHGLFQHPGVRLGNGKRRRVRRSRDVLGV